MEVLTDLLFGKAWKQILPDSIIAVLPPLVRDGPMTRRELDDVLREDPHSAEGLASSAWEPLHQWTDQELAELDEHFEDTSLAVEEQRTAGEVIAEDAARRARALGDMERYFSSLGLPVDHSIGGLVDLLVACQVLRLNGEYLSVNEAAPLPGEVLPLTPEVSAAQDELRWNRLHERAAQEVIAEFDVDGNQADVLHTSIRQLALKLERDTESVRSAVRQLLDDGDFSATVDVETVEDDISFDLRVDWERFSQTRIGIHVEHRSDDDIV